MSTRERKRPAEESTTKHDTPTNSGNDKGEELRQKADDLVRAADDAISRVVSSNSEDFLKAVPQTGGQ